MKKNNSTSRSKARWPIKALIGLAIVIIFIVTIKLFREEKSPNVAISRTQSSATVRVIEVKKRDLQSWVFAEGTARSAAREFLNFQSSGRIAYVDPELREGSLVKKGALLAYLDQRRIEADLTEASTGIEVAKTELKQAHTQAALMRKSFDRFATLVAKDSASQKEYDEAEAQFENARAVVARAESRIHSAEAKLAQMKVAQEDTELRAPIDGMIAYFNIEQGYYFEPQNVRTDSEESALNTVPIVMIDPGKFEMDVEIPDFEAGRVKRGQTVFINAGSSSDAEPKFENYIQGEVFSVNPAVSPSGRAIQVEIHTVGDPFGMKDGMFVTAWIAAEKALNQVTIPMETLLYRNNKPYVFVVNRETCKVERRDLVVELSGGAGIAIREGVSDGEWVVSDGRYQLSNGSVVRILGEDQKKAQTISEERTPSE